MSADKHWRKIKVTHIRTSHGVFGAERVILGLLKSADLSNFELTVTLVSNEPGLNRDFQQEIRRLGFGFENFLFNGRLDFNGIKKLRRYLKEEGFNLVHCHDFKANFYGLLATLGTGIKRITTVHGSTADSLLLRLYLAMNEYILIQFFHRVISVSRPLSLQLQAKILNKKKIAFIPNGLILNFFEDHEGTTWEPDLPITPGSIIAGTVGRLFKDKGHEILFKALVLLKDDFPNLILLIVGDGPHANYLRARRDELGLKDKVIFAGVRSNMRRVYDAMDLFVMPSIREGMPMAVLEVMFAGIPVVATRVGGIPEVLGEGRRGRLVAPGDVDGLASEIKDLLFSSKENARMSLEAAAFVREYHSSIVMAKRTEELYREVLRIKRQQCV